ncbi:MAG: phosphodiester glycosidase family protein [Treponema sp.]|jgi:hypothetical protein|nr:phosphodiester glycosidase family protein [Treponema sp.]
MAKRINRALWYCGILLMIFALLVMRCCSTLETGVLGPRLEDWSPRWQVLAPGVDMLRGRTGNPRLVFYALRIDLADPSLGVIVNDPGDGAGSIPSIKVSSFVRRYDCIAALNANPFSPVSDREGEARMVSGLLISSGVLVSPPYPAYDAIVFYAEIGADAPRAAIIRQSELKDTGNIEQALGGFSIILWKEEITVVPERTVRHPQSAAGLSADGSTLYLLAIDGRQWSSVGATEAETALILKRLGAYDGLNFDGGGSTALAVQEGGRVRLLNRPVHGNLFPGTERAVASCLGIIRR